MVFFFFLGLLVDLSREGLLRDWRAVLWGGVDFLCLFAGKVVVKKARQGARDGEELVQAGAPTRFVSPLLLLSFSFLFVDIDVVSLLVRFWCHFLFVESQSIPFYMVDFYIYVCRGDVNDLWLIDG